MDLAAVSCGVAAMDLAAVSMLNVDVATGLAMDVDNGLLDRGLVCDVGASCRCHPSWPSLWANVCRRGTWRLLGEEGDDPLLRLYCSTSCSGRYTDAEAVVARLRHGSPSMRSMPELAPRAADAADAVLCRASSGADAEQTSALPGLM